MLDPRTAHLPAAASTGADSTAAGRHRRHRPISPLLIAYLAPVAIAAAVTSSWFRFAGFIAGGDVAPFLRTNLATELTSSWSHQLTGAGSTSAPITQALEVVILRGSALLGLSPVWAQAALFGLCFGLAAFGAAFFAGVWARDPFIRAGAGLLGAFNTYLLVNQPNVLPALAIGLIGVSAGALLRVARTRGPLPRGAVVAVVTTSLLSSYLALNPPLLAMAVVAVVATAAAARVLVVGGSSARALRVLAVVGGAAVAVNLWWIVPLAQSLTTASGGATFSAQTNVSAWAWTQANSSLGAVAQLNGHWGWTDPNYYPYSHAMSGGWSVLSWLPPLLALAGVLAGGRDRLRARATLGATTLVLLFLAKGVHAPLGGVNLWLFVHVPGMWLFRDPMSKFGALLVLLYAALGAMALDRLAGLSSHRSAPAGSTDSERATRIPHVSPATAVAVVLAVLAVAYPWPLWSGAAIPTSRGALPGEHVRVPNSWYRAADAINSSAAEGKVLVLPLDPYYQVTTSWGYHGVDAIPAQLLKRPVVQQLPGGYYSGTSGFDALVRGVQASLLAGNGDIARKQLTALGVGLVVVRHDLRRSADLPPTADPAALENALRAMGSAALAGQFGVADVFTVTPVAGAARSSLVELHATNPDDVAAAIGAMPAGAAPTTDAETAVEAASWQLSSASSATTLRLATGGNYRVSSVPRSDTPYSPRMIQTGSGSQLVLSDAAVASIDGKPLPHRPDVVLPLTGDRLAALAVNGSPLPFRSEQPVPLAPGDEVAALALTPSSRPLLGSFSDVGDCDRRASSSTSRVSASDTGDGMELVAASDTACTFAAVALTGDVGTYRVQLGYRSVAGNQARICLWEQGPNHCAQLPALAAGNSWQTYTGFAHIDAGTTGLSLYLYADADTADGVTTRIDYKGITVDALRVIGTAHVSTAATPTSDVALAAGAHRVSFEAPPAASLPRFSALQDCDNHGLAATAGLSVLRKPNGAVRLHASADAACVSAAVATAPLARAYDLSVEYRTDSGRPARICVWQSGPDQCAALPALDQSPGWHTLRATFAPAPATASLSVYLYADGQQTPSTSVEYRNLTVIADTSLTVNVTQLAPAAVSRVTAHWSGGGSAYTAKVAAAAGRFVLVLPESFSAAWRLTGLPAGWTARHVEVDGYANGWAISGHGSAVLHATYSANRWSTDARAASVDCAIALLVSSSMVLTRRRRRRTRLMRSSRSAIGWTSGNPTARAGGRGAAG